MPTKTKIRMILVIYSFCITLLLLAAAIIYIETASPRSINTQPEVVFMVDQNTVIKSIGGTINISLNGKSGAVKLSDIEEYYKVEFFRFFPLMMISLFIIITAGSLLLWRILSRQSELHAKRLANNIESIEKNPGVLGEHPAIIRAYSSIKEKIGDFADDYVKLSSYISHDQKNSLARLRARLELAGDLDVLNDIDNISSGLDDVLTISATENMEHNQIVDLSLVCASVCDEYKKIYPNIFYEFDEYATTIIKGRELWLYRAISNLVGNGIKYGNGSDINISITNKKGSVIVRVTDGGIGIDKDDQERIFESRYRINKLNTDGYGIGLSLVQHVCDLCEGFIWVESKVNEGSSFYMVFRQALTLD